MRMQNPQLERTPTALVVRHLQLPQGCWFAFGILWLVLLAPAACVLLLALLIGPSVLMAEGGTPALWEFIGSWNIGLLTIGLILLFFVGIGAWMIGVGLRREHIEEHVWTFDKISRRLLITREMRNRFTKALRIEQVGAYPLPAPGSVHVREITTTEHFEHELVVTAGETKIHGMRQRIMFGDLRKVAREIDDFLSL